MLRRRGPSLPASKTSYFPFDLSVNLSFIEESLALLKEHDLIQGSKRMKGAHDDRPFERRILSKGYHFFVKILFNIDLSDTTCVKAFRRSKVIGLIDEIPTSSSIFETELVVVALKKGLKVAEIPVEVKDPRRSMRTFKMAGSMLIDLFSSRFRRP